ncbi:MAG: bifunctional hydroxymethylpyrimidine kinase/phosphomethylpyrimidine kinase [Gammaproteobacteria bacterium]|nr:bifunctional hydroxymethylpyrimidine kinase/phosphomethylpyrimidine kinase [Gammaproteobacteria bacterium]
MSQSTRPIVLTIAGTDPSGGAGIQADIKAISANGCYAASVITALVAQNTCGVQGIHPIPASFVTQQLDAVFHDLQVATVKIGMINDQAIMAAIVSALIKYPPTAVVLDPVMVAKNGSPLLKPDAIDSLKSVLFQHATLITPNLPEAEALLQTTIRTRDHMTQAAIALGDQFGCHVLIKGGHLKEDRAADVLFDPEHGSTYWFEEQRIYTNNTHGTGCSLSSAIAANLAKGHGLKEAISRAKHYLTQAIEAGKHQKIGHGAGPIDHFYFLDSLELNTTKF